MKHPEIARRWAKEYPGQQDLPKHAVVEAMIKKRVGVKSKQN
jgi:hypothetical protein